MASSTGLSAMRLALALLAPALLTGGLAARAMAQPSDRCEGTLCDLYYGATGGNNAQPAEQPTPPAAATPLTVPTSGFLGNVLGGGSQPAAAAAGAPAQAAAPAPLMQVGGGGLLGLARGAPQERCGGTLCDLFYGGPSPEEQREAGHADASDATQPARTALAPGAAPMPEDEPRRARHRGAPRERDGVEYVRAQPERPQCVAPPGDPWRCYRK